jgi:hypothetical protein
MSFEVFSYACDLLTFVLITPEVLGEEGLRKIGVNIDFMFMLTRKEDEVESRIAILAELLGAAGEGTVVRTPFHCDYGYNIRLGRGTFVNFGCVFLDVAAIELGDNCQVGSAPLSAGWRPEWSSITLDTAPPFLRWPLPPVRP